MIQTECIQRKSWLKIISINNNEIVFSFVAPVQDLCGILLWHFIFIFLDLLSHFLYTKVSTINPYLPTTKKSSHKMIYYEQQFVLKKQDTDRPRCIKNLKRFLGKWLKVPLLYRITVISFCANFIFSGFLKPEKKLKQTSWIELCQLLKYYCF